MRKKAAYILLFIIIVALGLYLYTSGYSTRTKKTLSQDKNCTNVAMFQKLASSPVVTFIPEQTKKVHELSQKCLFLVKDPSNVNKKQQILQTFSSNLPVEDLVTQYKQRLTENGWKVYKINSTEHIVFDKGCYRFTGNFYPKTSPVKWIGMEYRNLEDQFKTHAPLYYSLDYTVISGCSDKQ